MYPPVVWYVYDCVSCSGRVHIHSVGLCVTFYTPTHTPTQHDTRVWRAQPNAFSLADTFMRPQSRRS